MFNLSFLNSGILFAAIAAIIPLLIYLFARKKPHRIIFSSIKFIKQSQKQQKKKINLINILLLIIRMMIILFIILAISRPSIKSPYLKKGKLHPPTAVAIIIDNSPSMEYLIDTKTSLDKAKDLCYQINDILSERDATTILSLDESWNDLNSTIKFGKLDVSHLTNLTYSDLYESPETIIARAAEMLEESQLINKEIYFLTDGQLLNISENLQIPTYVIMVDRFENWQNISSSNVKPIMEFVDKGMTQKISFMLNNHSEIKQEDILYRLVMDNQTITEKMTDIKANQSKELDFQIELQEEGWQSGYVEVQNERLPWDNRNYFSFYHNPHPQLGIITSETSLPPTLSIIFEIYSGNKDNIQLLNQKNVNFEQLNQFDFLVIYKPEEFNQRIDFLLKSFEDQNKKILFITDQNLSTDWIEWIEAFYDVKFGQFNNENRSLAIDFINDFHPITRLINQTKSMQIRDYWKISATDGIILQTENYPVIIDKERSLLWLFDPTSLRNPFLVESSYPVILYNSLLYLSENGLNSRDYKIGDFIRVSGKRLTLPDGKKLNWTQNKFKLEKPGLYKLNEEIIPVNIDIIESDYKKVNWEKRKNLTLCHENWEQQILKSRYGFEIWKYLLLAVILLFAAEMIIIKKEEKKKR